MIRKEELLKAKEELLKLSKGKQESILIKGEKPILLTGHIITDERVPRLRYMPSITNDKNTFATLVYLLSKVSGCHAIIDKFHFGIDTESTNEILEKERKARSSSFLTNPEIREYITTNNIDALINHLVLYETYYRDLNTIEYNSSFIFCGRTGFSETFASIAENHNLTLQRSAHSIPTQQTLNEHGFKFTDDVINCYSEHFPFGVVQNRLLDRSEIWPRTMEIVGTATLDLDKLTIIANAELEFINKVTQEFEEKGPYDALDPMVYEKRK